MDAFQLRVEVLVAIIRDEIRRGVLDERTLKVRSGYVPSYSLSSMTASLDYRVINEAIRIVRENNSN